MITPRQARELFTALSSVGRRNSDRGAHLVAFFAGIYYSAARPAEMVNLPETDCKLPDEGGGRRLGRGGRTPGRCTIGAV